MHNTPHCIAAYLTSILSAKYVHEGMRHKKIKTIVAGVMKEMQNYLLLKRKLNKPFVNWYAKKELRRFSNVLLYDPVIRVAREPFRKLAANERLLGAAQLCLSAGIIPKNILIGIMAAFYYDNSDDPDRNIRYLIKSLEPKDFLKIVMHLDKGSALYMILLERWDDNLKFLKNLK